MANVIRPRRCAICDWLIPSRRLKRHPCAVLCGSPDCTVEHRRRRHARSQHNWMQARAARDPEFREIARLASIRYRKRRAQERAQERADDTQVPESDGYGSGSGR